MNRVATGGLAALLLAGTAWPALAQTDRERLLLMETTVQDLLKRDEEREKKVQALESEVSRLRGRRLPAAPRKTDEHRHDHGHDHGKPAQPAAPEQKHDHAHRAGKKPDGEKPHAEEDDGVWSAPVGDGVLKLRRIGLDIDGAFGWTTATQANVERLFAGGHDPRRNGFTLRSVELSFSGSYDPYFDAFVNIVYQLTPSGESKIELEEAWFQSKKLWEVATLKAGLFLTPFGVINPVHSHEWDFQTQPVILSRLFGEDGHRGPGFQAKLDLPTPWRSHVIVGFQNAEGETQASFRANDEFYGERPIGGYTFRPGETNSLAKLVYFARYVNVFALGGGTSLQIGGSAMFGPNATGSRGRTTIWGADATLTVPVGSMGKLRWISEFAQRHFRAEEQQLDDGAGGLIVLPRQTLIDLGFHSALLWDITDRWTVGARYEFASSRGESLNTSSGNGADPFRGNRHRVSPLVVWRFARLARVSAQYNYDHAMFLTPPAERRSVHSAFINLHWNFGLGASDHAGHDH
jgi:hypothetical protein